MTFDFKHDMVLIDGGWWGIETALYRGLITKEDIRIAEKLSAINNNLTVSYGECTHKETCYQKEKNMEDTKRNYEKPANLYEADELELNDQQWEVERLWQKAYDLHDTELASCQALEVENITAFLNCGPDTITPQTSILQCLDTLRMLEDMKDTESSLGLIEHYRLDLEDIYLKIETIVELRKSEEVLKRLEKEIRGLMNGRDKVVARLQKLRRSKERDVKLQKVRVVLEELAATEPEEEIPF